MSSSEILLPITEPETEWVRGRAVRKVSPTRDHSRLQIEFGAALNAWSRGRGEVGSEWRFRVALPGERRRPLIPDIAFVSNERLSGFAHAELQAPPFAPTVAIEILSQDDERLDVESKIDTYLRAGSILVVVIDPLTRSIALHDGKASMILSTADTFAHPALPGFEISLRSLFSMALDLPQ